MSAYQQGRSVLCAGLRPRRSESRQRFFGENSCNRYVAVVASAVGVAVEAPRGRSSGKDRLKCLAKEPQQRYESASALADELERWLRGEPIRARPAGTWEQVVKWVKRQQTVAGLWALSGIVTLIALAALFGASTPVVAGALSLCTDGTVRVWQFPE